MIYFLQPTDGGPVKIGYSADVDVRRRQLESHYGKPLSLLALIKGDMATEHEIHGRFAHLRFGLTEQFRPAADLMAFIGRPLLVGANPDAVEPMKPLQSGRDKVIVVRCWEAYSKWLARFVASERVETPILIDHALGEYARSRGFEPPPPR